MGTRTGAIDPGVLIALMRDEGLEAEGLEDLLYRRSGLLGISGLSSDMRELLASPAAEAARPSMPIAIRRRAMPGRWPYRSAGLMRLSSPAALAKMPNRCARKYWRSFRSWASQRRAFMW